MSIGSYQYRPKHNIFAHTYIQTYIHTHIHTYKHTYLHSDFMLHVITRTNIVVLTVGLIPQFNIKHEQPNLGNDKVVIFFVEK